MALQRDFHVDRFLLGQSAAERQKRQSPRPEPEPRTKKLNIQKTKVMASSPITPR